MKLKIKFINPKIDRDLHSAKIHFCANLEILNSIDGNLSREQTQKLKMW